MVLCRGGWCRRTSGQHRIHACGCLRGVAHVERGHKRRRAAIGQVGREAQVLEDVPIGFKDGMMGREARRGAVAAIG